MRKSNNCDPDLMPTQVSAMSSEYPHGTHFQSASQCP